MELLSYAINIATFFRIKGRVHTWNDYSCFCAGSVAGNRMHSLFLIKEHGTKLTAAIVSYYYN